jgi:predicted nucleic acid-binding protein
MSVVYFDTSALIKLIRIELDSDSLRAWIDKAPHGEMAWVSSALVLTEVPRALRRISPGSPLPDLASVLGRFTLRNVDEEILIKAGAYAGPTLRSLDAIHLATARGLADAAPEQFEAVLTYDKQLASAAEADGLPVLAPRH